MIEIQRRPEPGYLFFLILFPPILKRVYLNRGVTDLEQLNKAAKALHSYQKLLTVSSRRLTSISSN